MKKQTKTTLMGAFVLSLLIPVSLAQAVGTGNVGAGNATAGSAATGTTTNANTTTTTAKEGAKNTSGAVSAGADKNLVVPQKNCKMVQARVATRLKRYENEKTMAQKVFGGMVDKLTKIEAKLTLAKQDTTKLKADIATFKTKVEAISKEQTKFMESLKQTQQFACGKSQGEFVAQLGETRKMAPSVKTAISDARAFYRDTVRPDVIALIQSQAAAKATTGAVNNTTTQKATTTTTNKTTTTTPAVQQ